MIQPGRNMSVRNRWWLHLLILVAYTLLALAFTWPLTAHLSTHVPGNGADDPPLTWNLWWVRYALLNRGTNPFDCDHLFYPQGINLAFYTLTVLNGLLSVPVQPWLGLVVSSNLLLLSSFVLSGYGAFLLAAYLLRAGRPLPRRLFLAAFSAGLVYAFASSKLFYAALGQWNIASSQWIPFSALYVIKMGDEPGRLRPPLLAALFLLLQAYAELTYASFLALFIALWFAWRLATAVRRRQRLARLALHVGLVGAIALLGLAPLLANMLPDLRAEGDFMVEGGGFADVFSADLLGFLVPTMLHPLAGSWVGRLSLDHTVGQHLYPGYAVLAVALFGVWAWRRRGAGPPQHSLHPAGRSAEPAPPATHYADVAAFWSLSTLAFWLLTLGPSLRINGHDSGLPLPFALLAELPFFKANRYPSRFGVMLTLSLAVLVALGLAALSQAIDRRRAQLRSRTAAWRLVPGLLVLLMALEHLSVPLPLSDMRVPPVYHAIAADLPGDFALLDLPVGWRNGFRVTGTLDPIIMFEQYYQTVHGKRLLGGNTSRNPPHKFQYFTEAPVINTLIALETGHAVTDEVVERDRELAADVLRFFNIQAIVVHPTQAGPLVAPYVEAALPVQRLALDGEALAYRVELPPWPASWTVSPGHDLARLSYAQGWGIPSSGVAWAQRRQVRLLVPTDGQDQRLSFRAYAPQAGQRATVVVNGRPAATIALPVGWSEHEVSFPAALVVPGLNDILLRFELTSPAASVRLSPRLIGSTGVESPVNLVVQSAGLEVGDFGKVYVDGHQVSPDGRGYNAVVLDPRSGAVLQAASFDTHLDADASQALALFLDDLPPGQIVALAVADEASRLLDGRAVEALRGIGAVGDLRGKFRWGQAIVGVKGAAPGTALEAMDGLRPISLVVGEGATEPRLAAALSTITFTAQPRGGALNLTGAMPGSIIAVAFETCKERTHD